jgi:soluble lytic murein transglycosylase-like protein
MEVPLAVLRWQALCEKYAALSGGKDDSNNILPPVLLWQEIASILWNESTGNPDAVNPGDPSWGLMGVERWCGMKFAGAVTAQEIIDPEINIKAGSGYLSYLKARYAKEYPNAAWVAMYNCGEPAFLRGFRDEPYVSAFVAKMQAFGLTPQ